MNYKEFAKSLRDEALFQRGRFGRDLIATELESAATAIETLLAERDEALEALKMECKSCEYKNEPGDRPPCNRCINNYGFYKEWQWRGPQKEDGGDDQAPEPKLR